MESRKRLELSRETLRCLTSEVSVESLVDVRGGGDQSLNTCLETRCWIVFAPSIPDTGCFPTV